MLSFLLSKTGLALVAVMLVVAVTGVQSFRLANAKHDLAAAKAALTVATDRVKASETLRSTEYAKATTALGDAESACQGRVTQALQSEVVIHKIVTRPTHVDPKGCPVRELVSADELRHALGVGAAPTTVP